MFRHDSQACHAWAIPVLRCQDLPIQSCLDSPGLILPDLPRLARRAHLAAPVPNSPSRAGSRLACLAVPIPPGHSPTGQSYRRLPCQAQPSLTRRGHITTRNAQPYHTCLVAPCDTLPGLSAPSTARQSRTTPAMFCPAPASSAPSRVTASCLPCLDQPSPAAPCLTEPFPTVPALP